VERFAGFVDEGIHKRRPQSPIAPCPADVNASEATHVGVVYERVAIQTADGYQ
jgi:hypothetical protein